MNAISHEPPISARKPKNAAGDQRQRALECRRSAARSCRPGGPARSSRRAIASRRLTAGCRAPAAGRAGRPAARPAAAAASAARRRSSTPRARRQPVDRAAVEQQRHRQQAPVAQNTRRAAPAASGVTVTRPPSSCARISTNATAHSVPATPSASRPGERGRHLAHHAGREDVHRARSRAMPMPATM